MDASNWILTSSGPADEIRDQLTDLLREGDALIVIGAGSEAAWAGFTDADRLVEHLPSPPPPYPPSPADTRSKGQRIYDFALRSEGTPMSKFSQIIDDDWTGRGEYFKCMGAQFT